MELQVDVTKLPTVDEHVRFGAIVKADAEKFVIETAQDMELGAHIREKIKDRQKTVVSLLDPFIKAAHALHESHTTRRAEIIAPLAEAEAIISKKMVAWQIAEEKRIAEEQKKRDEEEKLRAAVQASEEGNEALAEAIIEDQIPVTAAPVEKTKIAGAVFSNTWTYEITDEKLIPREYLIPDTAAIKKVVTAMKDRCQIPGIKVFAQKSVKSARKDVTKRSF